MASLLVEAPALESALDVISLARNRLDEQCARAWLPNVTLFVRVESATHAPLFQLPGHFLRHEVAGALLIVALREQVVVIGEDMAHIGDERKPRRRFGCRVLQSLAVERVIDDRAEFMWRDFRRETPQHGFNRRPAQVVSSLACRC